MATPCPKFLASQHPGAERASKRYRTRTPEQIALDIEEGRRDFTSHRAGLRAFGPRQRDIDRAAIRRDAAIMRRQHVLPQKDDEYMEDDHTSITPILREHSMQTFNRELRVLRCVLRDEALERKEKEQTKRQEVIRYGHDAGRLAVEEFLARFKAFQLLGNLHSVPLVLPPGLPHPRQIVWAPPIRPDACSLAAYLGTYHAKANGLCGAIDSAWDHVTRVIHEDEWGGPQLSDKKKPTGPANPHALCYQAGICLMTPEGRSRYRFRNAFYRFMKAACPKKSRMRELAVAGKLALRLRGSPRDSFFEPDELGWDEFLGEDADLNPDKFVVWHLSEYCLTPYTPSFQPMAVPEYYAEALASGVAEIPAQAAQLAKHFDFRGYYGAIEIVERTVSHRHCKHSADGSSFDQTPPTFFVSWRVPTQ